MATSSMPPTTHALPHAQRLRLMRSTRKLGALLGETPLLVETSPTAASFSPSLSRSVSTMSTDSKRSGRVYLTAETPPRTSSLNLAAASGTSHSHSDASHVPRPMLLLHLPAAGHSAPAALPSPLSPTFSLALNSPLTPTLPVDSSRRRKMAKLVRTLGENVPPELVFGPTTPKARRRASTLTSNVPESTLEREWDMMRTPAPVPGDYLSVFAAEAEGRSSSDTHSTLSADTHASDELLLPRGVHDGMHRQEQGWSGEWGGVANMQDVVRSLRGLRMK